MTPGARLAAAAAAAGASFLAARSEVPPGVDRRVAAVLGRPAGTVADRGVAAFTDLGSVYGLAGVAVALASRGRGRLAVDVAVAGGAAWTVAQAAKRLVERQRPYQATGAARLVSEPHGTSWPSGHTAVAAAMAAALRPALTPTAGAAATALATAVGASRCYVGVHWATDVIAGAAVGEACAVVTRAVVMPPGRRAG